MPPSLSFQYNTCFYLSCCLADTALKEYYFNTTLVFIYPLCQFSIRAYTRFQYNTCFYLSQTCAYSLSPQKQFQYNTCFYLSYFFHLHISFLLFISIQHLFLFIGVVLMSTYEEFNFNTTLVFIYQYLISMLPLPPRNFNTTLVFIYHASSAFVLNELLFQYNTCFYLSGTNTKNYFYFLFQYNTCFYLSCPGRRVALLYSQFQYNTCFYLSV